MTSETRTGGTRTGGIRTGRIRTGPAAAAGGDVPALSARGLSLGHGARTVVDGLDLDVPAGAVTALVGPNGCGKSTLLRGLARLLPARAGRVLLQGTPIEELPTREVARRLALLPQSATAPEGLTVADLVARGRQPHQSWWRQWSAADADVVAEALRWTDALHLARRPLESLSGGQRQRAWISMVLAQGTPVVLLDEPTNHLDLAHAVEVMGVVGRLSRELGRTVLVVLHDLNLAFRACDHLVVLHEGRVAAQGRPADVVDEELLARVFGLRALVVDDPAAPGSPLVVPLEPVRR